MKRIGILTAGGDTPALNAAIHGAVVRANELKVEVYGLIRGFNCLFNPRVPHVHLNPLFQEIPELDPTKGGTLIGSSRDYVDPAKKDELDFITERLRKLGIEGLIAVGGDGTLNGLQPLTERLPTVLAPKTIDNDLGLNYPSEPDEGFHVEGYDANRFRDRWGLIHARQMHPSLYDPVLMKPSTTGIDYLLPIFTGAIGYDDAEHIRHTLFDSGNLSHPYHSINTDAHKRIRYLEADGA
jgi:Phosphofructokinase